jgi:excisionase family DNA binding protein
VLTYPGLVPLAAREEINALVEASLQTIKIDTVDRTIGELAIAIAHALYRVAVIEPAWSAEDFRVIVDDLVAQVIDQAYVHLHGFLALIGDHVVYRSGDEPPLQEDFATQVRSALHASPAWTRVQDLAQRVATPAAAPPIPLVDSRPPLTIKEAAKKLGVSDSTIERMIVEKRIHAATVGRRQKRIPASEIDRLLAKPKYQYPDR